MTQQITPEKHEAARSVPEPATPPTPPPAPATISTTLTPGDTAPAFSLPAQTGQTLSSHKTVGNPLVLFFYLSDEAVPCTAEAIGFRDLHEQFKQLGVTVVGVNVDPVASHKRFADQHQIPFPLLSDANAHVCLKYGAADAQLAGAQATVSLARTTFLIDPNNRIAKIYRGFNPADHAAEVLDD